MLLCSINCLTTSSATTTRAHNYNTTQTEYTNAYHYALKIIYMKQQLVSKKTLAERLNVHKNTVTNMEKRGEIRGIHTSTGLVRYDYSEVLSDLKAKSKK